MIRRASPAELLAAALSYAELGWQIVPLHEVRPDGRCSCGKDCGNSAGKHPRLPAWQKLATHEEKAIRSWWSRWPSANVGLRTGSLSGVVAVDVDPPLGEASLLALSDGDLPPTVECLTGKGRRLLYSIPDSLEREPRTVCFKDDGDNETVRLQGGETGAQCLLPPSWHYSGRPYLWVPGRGPGEVVAAPMPAWAVALMCPPAEPTHAASPAAAWDGDSPFAQFNARGDWWRDLLLPSGARRCGGASRVEYATRPGKAGGVSASLGHYRARDGTPALHVFSGNWPLLEADRTYDLAGAFARVFHGGDFAAAARDLAAKGYGSPRSPPGGTVEERVARLERENYKLARALAELRLALEGKRGREA